MTKKIIGGVEITENDDGSASFRAIDNIPKEIAKDIKISDNRNWWQKLCDWWDEKPVTPYIRFRELNKPDDPDEDYVSKSAGEIGIRIRF